MYLNMISASCSLVLCLWTHKTSDPDGNRAVMIVRESHERSSSLQVSSLWGDSALWILGDPSGGVRYAESSPGCAQEQPLHVE